MVYNTIFDDVFRTMIEKMPSLVIPLVNEVFQTSYPDDVEIIHLRNEFQDEQGEVITDSCLKIENKLYHIECQSTDDTTMAVRMIEYDFRIGSAYAKKDGRRYRMEFPKSCVLYLRSGANTPDFLEVDVVLPDESTFLYKVPTVKMEAYTKEDIFSKKLLMLLPFYVIRYGKHASEYEKDPVKLNTFLVEYEDIRMGLEKELTAEGKAGLYTDLVSLIVKIADYIFQGNDKVQKGIGDVMGGKVLELESERLFAAGKTEGRTEGRAEGRAEGREEGKAEGEELFGRLISVLIRDGKVAEITQVAQDPEIRKKYYQMYGLETNPDKEMEKKLPEAEKPVKRRGR